MNRTDRVVAMSLPHRNRRLAHAVVFAGTPGRIAHLIAARSEAREHEIRSPFFIPRPGFSANLLS